MYRLKSKINITILCYDEHFYMEFKLVSVKKIIIVVRKQCLNWWLLCDRYVAECLTARTTWESTWELMLDRRNARSATHARNATRTSSASLRLTCTCAPTIQTSLMVCYCCSSLVLFNSIIRLIFTKWERFFIYLRVQDNLVNLDQLGQGTIQSQQKSEINKIILCFECIITVSMSLYCWVNKLEDGIQKSILCLHGLIKLLGCFAEFL